MLKQRNGTQAQAGGERRAAGRNGNWAGRQWRRRGRTRSARPTRGSEGKEERAGQGKPTGEVGRGGEERERGFFSFFFKTKFNYEPNANSNIVLNILFNSNKK